MANKNSTKRNFLASLAATGLSVSMLVGTTFAWFTDSVTSSNNIIKTGTLKVSMYYNDDCGNTWNDASTGAIFEEKNWQPNDLIVKYVKISNDGSLDLKYQLSVIPNVALDGVKLSDVVDVYYTAVDEALDDAELLDFETSMTSAGTVSYVMENGLFVDRELTSGEDVIYAIGLHMDGAKVGNKYQNLSMGEGFTVQLLATQAMYEAEYDANQAVPMASVQKRPDLVGATIAPSDYVTGNPDIFTEYPFLYDGPIELETAYDFTTPVEVPDNATIDELDAIKAEIQATNPYAMWHADFVVSFDKDVAPDEIAIAGNYGDYGWIPLKSVDIDSTDSVNGIPANTGLRLLQSVLGVYMNYSEVCVDVQNFICGAWDLTGNNAGLVMTVELRLYEVYPFEYNNSWNDETGHSIVIGSYTYTF